MNMDFVSGEVIAIDKPLGWTSFDAVKRLRGALSRRLRLRRVKVGHAGTLDPLATGVLLICTGKATKQIERLQAGRKEYIATMRLGATTPSFDLEHEIDATYPTAHITEEAVRQAIAGFTGVIMQVPPAFSAVKISGNRAYNMAREGIEVELKAKPLIIDEMELLSCDLDSDQPSITLRILCSKGTYIRALARDIGRALNSGAHLTALRRTRVGDFSLADCLSLEQAVELIRCCELSFPENYDGPEPREPQYSGPPEAPREITAETVFAEKAQEQ